MISIRGGPRALRPRASVGRSKLRMGSDKPHAISWDQLAKPLDNEGQKRRFRQTVRDSFDLVSGVFLRCESI
jgi:hypothetical protein